MNKFFHRALFISLSLFGQLCLNAMPPAPQKQRAELNAHGPSKSTQLKIFATVACLLLAAIAVPNSTEHHYMCAGNPALNSVNCHSVSGQICSHPYVSNGEIVFAQIHCPTNWVKAKASKKTPKAKTSKTHKKTNR